MHVGMSLRGGVLAARIVFALPLAAPLAAVFVSAPSVAQTMDAITVEGNRRVEADTIRSYFKPGPNGALDAGRIDDGLKALIETGLFQDVKISRPGGRVVVTVVENAVIGRIAFEGNKKVKDEQLSAEIQSKPRGTFSRPMVQSDAQRIAEIYRRSGRYDVHVTPEIIEQPNNRVDLVFTIAEGQKTGVKSIEFVGNTTYSSYRLKDIIKTRESNLLSFLGGNDVYDPDRVEADRDLIRRFYLKNGFADVQVVAALTEYDPERKGFLVTFKIEEGQQYRVGSVDFQSSITTLDGNALRGFSRVNVGSLYNVEAVEKSVEEMQIEASRRGYAFAVVRPRGDRNFDAHTVSVVFAVDEGPRVYIERINVRGNTRTRDFVIRREFDISEGDAYNRALVDRAERRLKNLDFFKSVKITTEPGSSSDRVVLIVELEEKSTGDFSVSGGYSTTDGALAEVSISERNFLGRGLFAKASVSYGQYSRGASLSFVEPYLLDYRVALGLDVSYRQQLATSTTTYGTTTLGFSPRLGFQLREDLSLQLRYSIYRQEVTLTSAYNNCNNNASNSLLAFNPTPAYIQSVLGGVDPTNASTSSVYGYGCYGDGEASLPVRKELANGASLTSALGYTLNYNILDNNKNPTQRTARRLPAGFRRRRRRRHVSQDRDRHQVLHAAGLRHRRADPSAGRGPDADRQQRIAHARPLPDGTQPGSRLCLRTASDRATLLCSSRARPAMRWAAPNIGEHPTSCRCRSGSCPRKSVSRERSMPMPAHCWITGDRRHGRQPAKRCKTRTASRQLSREGRGTCTDDVDNGNQDPLVVGVGLIWASPFGPLRFDYAVPLTKGPNDRSSSSNSAAARRSKAYAGEAGTASPEQIASR